MKIYINDDAHISSKQLFFRQSHTFTNVKSSDVSQMTFRASHTPATLQVEICEGDSETEFTAYTSPFITEPSADTYADQTKFSAKSGIANIPLPYGDKDPAVYQNINYFNGIGNKNSSVSSYMVTPIVGSARPAIPQD